MSKSVPDPGAVQVFNRSDRVWVYGYVRTASLVLFLVGPLGILMLTDNVGGIPSAVGLAAVLAIIFGLLALERAPLFNTVKCVWLGDRLHVARMAGRTRAYPPDRVQGVELAQPEGQEYDDNRTAGPLTQVTIRLHQAWPVRLLVAAEDARRVTDWAAARQKPVVQGPP